MNIYPFAISLSIESSQVVQPYEHVHHADILKLFEECRLRLLESRGFPLNKFLEQELFWVISDIEVNYLREVKLGLCRLTCEAPILEERKVKLPQKLYNHKNKLAVQAEIGLMLFSKQAQRAIPLTEQALKVFRAS